MIRIALGLTLFLLVAAALPAHAIATQPANPVITTIGYGRVSAPAENMVLSLVFEVEEYYGGPPHAPVVEATPGTTARATMEPVIAAIAATSGVESVDTIIPAPIGGIGRPTPTARLDIHIVAPTQEMLMGIVNDAARVSSHEFLVISYIGAYTEVADCVALEMPARQAALDDATAKASVQADLLGVVPGDPVTVTDLADEPAQQSFYYYGWTQTRANSCAAPTVTQRPLEFGVIGPVFDPATQQPVFEMSRIVEVSWSSSGAPATPAS